jgi:hypothetical protein
MGRRRRTRPVSCPPGLEHGPRSDGEICLYSFAPAHLLADINGYFPG